jgi:uncharacterized damage-inducible protein DinB
MEHFRRLLAHLAWADHRAHEAIAAASPTQAAEAMGLYAHVLAAEHLWLTRLQQQPAAVLVWPTLTLAEARALAAANQGGLTDYLDTLTPADFGRQVRYVNSPQPPITSRSPAAPPPPHLQETVCGIPCSPCHCSP